jgi:NAD(P)H dehydrogenase (quinone)
MSKQILIIFAGKTRDGSTATLANNIARGVNNVSGMTAVVKSASDTTKQDFLQADGVICGSGDYNGNPEPSMIDFFDNTLGAGMTSDMKKIQTMPFGVFATSGGYGTGVQEILNSMARSLMTFGGIYVGGGNWHVSQGISGMTEKNGSGGWQWANADSTQKYLLDDACEYGRRIALATLAISDNIGKLSDNNPTKCSNKPSPPHNNGKPTQMSLDTKVNIGLAIVAILCLQIIFAVLHSYKMTNLGLSLVILFILAGIITVIASNKSSAIVKRRNVAIVAMAMSLVLLVASSIYGRKHSATVPQNISLVIISSSMFIILFSGIVLLTSKDSGSSPGPGPDPKPSIKCSNSGDCPNPNIFNCSNNVCVLKDTKLKSNIVNYLDSIYPATPKLSSTLSDTELYNFFVTLGYYWLSFNSPNAKNILQTLDSKFPTNIACGGFYVVPASDDTTACGSNPHTDITSDWPCTDGTKTCKDPCCEPGSLSIPPDMNQLYFCDYITKSTEVLRNGYDLKNTLSKSVLYDPVYLYHTKNLSVKDPLQHLCLIKDGVDASGKQLSYKVCDGSKPYDFTVMGPGFSSNSLAGCVRNLGTSGHATDTFYYIAQGTGNHLELGVTARMLNKVHGTLLMIQRAGQLDFGSLQTYKMGNKYTTTKQSVKLSDGSFSNSFVQAPQLLLLECLARQNANIAFQNPTSQAGFGSSAAKSVAPNVKWPFSNIVAQSSPQQSFSDLLTWYFGYKKVKLPDTSDYTNNWSNWNKKAVDTLGMFFDAVSVPEFDQWELNYFMNRMGNSADYDIIIYALVGAKNVEITGTGDTETPGPLKTDGKTSFPGVTNMQGKYIETFGCAIQPGGAGGWAYELIDYRLNLSHAQGQTEFWTEYANKFIKVGNPLSTSSVKSCTPRYCTDTDQAACEPGKSGPAPADWLVLTCQAPLAPVKTMYSCTDGTCNKDPNGKYQDLASCKNACNPPGTQKCKDIAQGEANNYCSEWCNSPHTQWTCGDNSDGSMTCNCAGCNGCP